MRERVAAYVRYVVLLGLACLLVALGAWLVIGEAPTWVEILAAVGLLLLAVSVLLKPGEVKAALTGRQARYGGNALLMSLAFVLIIGLLNYLGTRHHWRWDATAEKQFSLSEQSLQILRALKEPVHVKLFFTPMHYNRQQAEDLLKEYTLRSGKLTYEFVDPDLDRRQAMDYQIGRDGTIVFERGSRREVTFGVQEQDLTSALLKVTRDQMKGVYFLTGHQERDPDSTEAKGYSDLKSVLQSENYTVGALNFAVTNTIPSDMAVLVVAGPQKPLSAEENKRLVEYINGGGRVLALVEPGMPDPFTGTLKAYGIDLPDTLVVDSARSFFGDVAAPLVDRYTFHQITKDMTGLTSFFPTARAIVKLQPPPQDWNVVFLATSSANSWAETNYRAQQVRPDEGEVRGEQGLVAVIEPSGEAKGRGRLVVAGDADFCANDTLRAVRGVGNLDLFMNAVNWLAEEEELISIRPKLPEQRQVVLTAPQARAIIYSNILFVPLLVLAVGAVVWWRRR